MLSMTDINFYNWKECNLNYEQFYLEILWKQKFFSNIIFQGKVSYNY